MQRESSSIPDQQSDSPGTWASWLAEQEAITSEEYCRNPKRLLADHGNETSATRDYVGREVLELLQNANDAAIEAGVQGRVRVELHPGGLLVANTGAVSTREGVDSLRLAHLSPKRARYARARALKESHGFDTVIGMPFDHAADALTEARRQLGLLQPEVLLFARGVVEVVLAIEDRPPQEWQHKQVSVDLSRIRLG